MVEEKEVVYLKTESPIKVTALVSHRLTAWDSRTLWTYAVFNIHCSAKYTNLGSIFESAFILAMTSALSSADVNCSGGFDLLMNAFLGPPWPSMMYDSSFPMSNSVESVLHWGNGLVLELTVEFRWPHFPWIDPSMYDEVLVALSENLLFSACLTAAWNMKLP